MKYAIIMAIIIALFLIKPLRLSEVSKLVPKTISVEVKGHVKNQGIFEVANYATISDLIKDLNLYEDSDLKHYSLNTKLVNNQIISVRQKTKAKLVSINSGSLDDLVTLKGIGEKIGGRIIEYRNLNGGFKKLEELLDVKGIGEKIFQNIKDFITL